MLITSNAAHGLRLSPFWVVLATVGEDQGVVGQEVTKGGGWLRVSASTSPSLSLLHPTSSPKGGREGPVRHVAVDGQLSGAATP